MTFGLGFKIEHGIMICCVRMGQAAQERKGVSDSWVLVHQAAQLWIQPCRHPFRAPPQALQWRNAATSAALTGCVMTDEIAASMRAIRSRFWRWKLCMGWLRRKAKKTAAAGLVCAELVCAGRAPNYTAALNPPPCRSCGRAGP